MFKKILLSDNNLHVEKENLKPYMSSQINLNTRTINSHTELDASYTLIHVPKQHSNNNPFYFYFQLDGKNNDLKIKLNSGVTLSYSSYILTHSQRLNRKLNDDDYFINISSYLSDSLYNSIVKSINRVD